MHFFYNFVFVQLMKNVLQLLKMDHKHLEHQLCHPRKQASFDNDNIQKKIEQIRQRKEQLRVEAQRKKQQIKAKQQRFQDYPLEQLLQQTMDPLSQKVSMLIKQKIKFIEDKVYIGTKNNVNNEFIARIIDENEASDVLKDELNLFMEDILGNIQSDIIDGEYDIFNKKELILPKNQDLVTSPLAPNPTKLIQLKKVELSHKIEELKEQLVKTEKQQEELSPRMLKNKKSFSIRSSSVTEGHITQSLNIEDFSIKSQKTRKAQEFVKSLRKQQQAQRQQRKRKLEQQRKMEIKSQQERKQFEEQLKIEKHQNLKKKYQKQRQQKVAELQKVKQSKQKYEQFLKQYRKRVPLFKAKEVNFEKKQAQQQKKRALSVLSEIKEAKRSIDIEQLKEHEKKYQIVRKEFEKEKLENLKHRQKEIYLRHKQDKLYYRGRYHSLIQEQKERTPENPALKVEQFIKKRKSYAQKVKKEHVPHVSENKQKQLEELIKKIDRNKPAGEVKDYHELGNKYLKELHKLIGEMKQQGKVKVKLPQEIKPRYRNYLEELKRSRNYSTVSYDIQDSEQLEKRALRLEQRAKRKEQILSLTEDIDIPKQLEQINQLDLQLLQSAQMKMKLLHQYDPVNSGESSQY